MSAISTSNNGPRIVSSTYWGSDYDKKGAVYLSVNAGTWRLMLPTAFDSLTELLAAEGVAITRGIWRERGVLDAVEILFDDGSESPFAFHIGTSQVDRLPPGDDRTERKIVLYGPGPTELGELPCFYRRGKIPCLKEWKLP